MGQFFSLPPIQPLKLPTPPSASIDMMSVYQPFPLRVDSFGEQGKQYDACFQIGEFPGKNVNGTGIVILVPLKVNPNPGVGGQFVNAFASKIPNILGAQPDPLLGYPDVPAQTGANWDVSKVVDVTRPYYTWAQEDGTRVIVMAEPILIAQADMTNIQRLPVTPPEDVIHEIGTPILYRPAPPRDANGRPVPCPQTAAQKAVANVVQPPLENKPNVDSNILLEVLLGIIGTLAIIIGVWFGVKMASGPVGDSLKRFGDSIGSTLAGGYGAVKKATSNTLGIGWKSNPNVRFPPKRTPSPPPSPKPNLATEGLKRSTGVPNPQGLASITAEDKARTNARLDEIRAKRKQERLAGTDQFQKANPMRARSKPNPAAGTGLTGGKRKKRRNRMKTGRKV